MARWIRTVEIARTLDAFPPMDKFHVAQARAKVRLAKTRPNKDNVMRFIALAIALISAPFSGMAQVIDQRAIDAVTAAGAQDWQLAYSIVGTSDPVTADVITWLRLREGEADFVDYMAFTAARPDWPQMDRIRARAEEAIPEGFNPAMVIEWFGDFLPQTGEGAVRLADALMATGRKDAAEDMLVDTWLTQGLTETGHQAMIDRFADLLAPYNAARTDALLWRWRTLEAERMVELLDAGQAALARAKIGYLKRLPDAETLARAVPDGLKDDTGLAYARYGWLASRGAREEAIEILRARSVSAEAMEQPFRWSGWRRILARSEMREGRAQSAYELAAKHYLTQGEAFADLEWLAGYIALTYLDQPAVALTHFQAADAAVGNPIEEGRMQYWIARTQEVLGDQLAARAAYAGAAQHQTGFYGLLAAQKLGLSLDPDLTGRNDPADWQNAPFLSQDLTRAALALLQAGERVGAVPFFAALGKRLDATELSQLGALLAEMDEPYFEVLLGKTALTRDILVPSIYFPLHPMAEMELPVAPALALSIARRESEFNAGIGSAVGALGLMQLMPATAQELSEQLGEPYSRNRLTADPAYNVRLGATYLSQLQEQFGYSPVMMAAGYNAGPSRPRTWMAERGDPRIGEADIIDWIENIPFRETRNYVMRVAESIPIYEARLTGETGPIRFMELLIGEKPVVRPRTRPEPVAPLTSRRPVSRPEG